MGHIQYFRPYFLHSFTNKISSPLHSHPAPSICKSHLEGRVDEAHVQLDILPVENRGSNRLIIAEPSARGGQNHWTNMLICSYQKSRNLLLNYNFFDIGHSFSSFFHVCLWVFSHGALPPKGPATWANWTFDRCRQRWPARKGCGPRRRRGASVVHPRMAQVFRGWQCWFNVDHFGFKERPVWYTICIHLSYMKHSDNLLISCSTRLPSINQPLGSLGKGYLWFEKGWLGFAETITVSLPRTSWCTDCSDDEECPSHQPSWKVRTKLRKGVHVPWLIH